MTIKRVVTFGSKYSQPDENHRVMPKAFVNPQGYITIEVEREEQVRPFIAAIVGTVDNNGLTPDYAFDYDHDTFVIEEEERAAGKREPFYAFHPLGALAEYSALPRRAVDLQTGMHH